MTGHDRRMWIVAPVHGIVVYGSHWIRWSQDEIFGVDQSEQMVRSVNVTNNWIKRAG
jgi:hypothetical protein